MAKKKGSREMPEMNTSSLPDLIFTILFFFMIVTTMREVTLKVKFVVPAGTELEKLCSIVRLRRSPNRPASCTVR